MYFRVLTQLTFTSGRHHEKACAVTKKTSGRPLPPQASCSQLFVGVDGSLGVENSYKPAGASLPAANQQLARRGSSEMLAKTCSAATLSVAGAATAKQGVTQLVAVKNQSESSRL